MTDCNACTSSLLFCRSLSFLPIVCAINLMYSRGKNGFFEFNQIDYGVQFVPFLRDIIQPNDAKWQSHSESLTETNR